MSSYKIAVFGTDEVRQMRLGETSNFYGNKFLILYFTVGKKGKGITSGTPSRMFSISRRAVLPTIVTSASFLSINYEML